MLFYTTNELIEAIKRNISVPTAQKKFSPDDFIKFLNEEMELRIKSVLLEMKEDYYISILDVPLVASVSEYAIPSSAVGWKIDQVGYKDADGNYRKLSRVSRSQRGRYRNITDLANGPDAYYIEDNHVSLIPSMGTTASGSLVFDFVRINNTLVLEGECSLVSSVVDTGSAYELTVNTVTDTADGVDVVSGTNPFGIIARDETAVVSGTTITIASDNFEREPVKGDYVCSTGTTPIPNIPSDYHQALAQAGAIRCLAASNDLKGMQSAEAVLGQMLSSMSKRSSKRVSSSPRKIVSNSSILNSMRGFY